MKNVTNDHDDANVKSAAGNSFVNQHWLSIAPVRNSDGTVLVVIDIHGHFGALAASDAADAIADAIERLFDLMGDHVKQASVDAVEDLRLATRSG